MVAEFLSSTKSLEDSYAPGNNPSRSEIHLSLCGISSSVLRLLDLIDSLFVSKFPMRKQVYTFTEKLIELGMAYKPVDRKGGREGEAISDMRKQLPALQNSAKVSKCNFNLYPLWNLTPLSFLITSISHLNVIS